ncbi:hypothetical protein JI742_06625 [Piscinibacter sp. Jin2]|uniref:Uncharacterized protein n=1 Tax=Aquariibacter lacus TaxID=2801332 RepID=A0A9X0XEL6_9BURK|nr:hypothetical protein [Piscinibacter lacus]MBL0719561.1 hypothetical protein [Piscinibacter lacus]
MPEKLLTEAAWKSFAKNGDHKDAALLKALKALDQAAKDDPSGALHALDDIEEQIGALRKAGRADKALGSHLNQMEVALGKERKLQQKQLDAQSKDADGADVEDSPTLLTTKLLPLLREVRKGSVTMSALIVTAGKDAAVMLARRPIPPARSKLLKEYLGISAGTKIIPAECLLEDNAVTFLVQSQATGLAKKLKQALLNQVEQRLKVRVRGLEPGDVDEEAEDEAPEGQGQAPVSPTGSEPVDETRRLFLERLDQLSPRVAAALRDQKGDTGKLRAVIAFAREKGEAAAWTSGLKALETLEKLLEAAAQGDSAASSPTSPPETAGKDGKVGAGAAFNARLAALMPKLKEALGAGGPAATDLKLKVSEAGVTARKGLFDEAHALLDDAEALLTGSDEEPSSPTDPLALAWRERLQGTARALGEKAPPGHADAAKLQAILDHANKLAAGGDWRKALAALDQLDKILAARTAPPPGETADPQPGPRRLPVAYLKSVHAYRKAAALVKGRIQTLKQAIPQALPTQQELIDTLAEVLDQHNELLLEAVDDAMTAIQGEQGVVTQALADTIDTYLDLLSSDPLIKAADSNPFGVQIDLQDTLFSALSEVRRTMPEPN